MGRLSLETRSKVIIMRRNGYLVSEIHSRLAEEGVSVSKVSLFALLKKFNSTGLVVDLKRKPRSSLLGHDHYRFIDETMTMNNELTSGQLFSLFTAKYPEIQVSTSTIKRARRHLGWISKKTRYCALIREANKEKRLLWCQQRVEQNDLDLKDVIFSDESSVQLESHRKTCYHKIGQPSRLCGKPKHPLKVHVWGGISARGATQVVIFSGIMNATRYTDILDGALVPFIEGHYPTSHRFQQDNDPKHTSRWAQNYFQEKNINWWKTPASSPDLNPIENVWGSRKNYLRTNIKPKNLQELKDGIKEFWLTLTPSVCQKYIGHLKKVIPKVIEENGGPSGY